MNTPVRCCMAACDKPGEFFEPDGRFWFCDGCFSVHLLLRRQEWKARKQAAREQQELNR